MTELQNPSDTQSFDPRFPLAYQPGYDPQVHGRQSVLRRPGTVTGRPTTPRQAGAREEHADAPETAAPREAHADRGSAERMSETEFRDLFDDDARGPRTEKDAPPVATLLIDGVPSAEELATTASVDASAIPVPWWRRVNPWASGLLLGGPFIVVVAIWWGYSIASAPMNRFGSTDEFAMYLYQWSMVGVPMVFAAGLIITALGATAFAVRWRR